MHNSAAYEAVRGEISAEYRRRAIVWTRIENQMKLVARTAPI
jgi:hypothetical protein